MVCGWHVEREAVIEVWIGQVGKLAASKWNHTPKVRPTAPLTKTGVLWRVCKLLFMHAGLCVWAMSINMFFKVFTEISGLCAL